MYWNIHVQKREGLITGSCRGNPQHGTILSVLAGLRLLDSNVGNPGAGEIILH